MQRSITAPVSAGLFALAIFTAVPHANAGDIIRIDFDSLSPSFSYP